MDLVLFGTKVCNKEWPEGFEVPYGTHQLPIVMVNQVDALWLHYWIQKESLE